MIMRKAPKMKQAKRRFLKVLTITRNHHLMLRVTMKTRLLRKLHKIAKTMLQRDQLKRVAMGRTLLQEKI
ncbi:hypothetical protein ACMD2_25345 [Ananas comosus]|uniref:Uncharacterized protein n=1 Tax=Ananas comosus TaxID=4615 RepID=A0A199UQZ9_ANACO|nr:hypothetical protein ACMD2_25345 [Ananas comosus]